MVMLTWLSRPGPSAERAFMPSSLAIGPFTTSNGACGLVDINSDVPPCEPICDNAFTDAIITGMCSGFAPAIAALMAIFSTVARPKPGGMSQISSSASKLEPAINSSTASAVGRMEHEGVAPVAHQPLLIHLENGVPAVFAFETLDLGNLVTLASPVLLVDGGARQ